MFGNINHNQEGNQYFLKLFINKIQVPNANIKQLSFREWIFDKIIYLDLEILDNGTFVENSPLYDSCPIRLEYSLSPEDPPNVINFELVMFESGRLAIDNGSVHVHKIEAIISSNFFNPINTLAFASMTSLDAIKKIAANSNIEVVSDVDARDTQTWYQINETDYEMMGHVLHRSYVSEEDLPLLYMTRDSKLKYTSLVTLCDAKTKFTAINNPLLVVGSNVDPVLSEMKTKLENETKTKIIYFNTSTHSKNVATLFNCEYGYGTNFTHFDTKDLRQGSINFKYNPLSDRMNRNKNHKSLVNSITYNYTTSNTHDNYLLARTQNLYINSVFFNQYLQVSISPDTSIQIGDKVEMNIPSSETRMAGDADKADKVNSGTYIVGSILHDFNKEGVYNMVLVLFRNGINDSDTPNILMELE